MPALSNPRHERFAQALAEGKTCEDAYVLAGYKPNRGNASSLKSKEHISNRLAELLSGPADMALAAVLKAAEALSIDKAWVMRQLVENVEKAMQAVPVKDHDGKPTGEYRYDGAVANKALELLGREFGMFISRTEVGGPGDFSRLSDTELQERLANAREQLFGLGAGSGPQNPAGLANASSRRFN